MKCDALQRLDKLESRVNAITSEFIEVLISDNMDLRRKLMEANND